ncbi:MAG: ABC transporter ATP-binding protein [Oscillospiraceae bacterium]|nr:ABC transporter ATP-binding protein [Oscillospiraceae bacterium]
MRKKYTFRETLRPLSFLLRRMLCYPGLLLLSGLTLVITTACTLVIPYFSKLIINDYILTGDLPGLVCVLAVMGLLYIVSTISTFATSRILVRISQKMSRDLRRDLFDRMQTYPMEVFHNNTHGQLMSSYTNDIDTISSFVSSSMANVVTNLVGFFGMLTILLVMNPLLTLVSAVFLVIQYLVIKKSGGISRRGFVQQQASLADLNGFIEEYTEGQKIVKLFHHEEAALEGFERRNQQLQDASYRAQIYAGIINPALGGIAEINNAMTCTVGVIMTITGMFDLGSLVSFIQYLKQCSHQIGGVANIANMILSAVAGTERIMDMLEKAPEIDEGTVTLENGTWSNGEKLSGRIEFRDMGFGYVPEQPVLQDISFVAEPGKKIALVGSTGAGKTTITNLLNRFYEIGQGSITYDGIDLTDIKKSALRGTLSMVLQDTHLFTGTVRENIRFGRLDATDEEVEQAAVLANADFFIRHLPQGYDTVLTADGSSLSQGQRQLLAIARAAVANPMVLVLDEATSSIDTHTEKLIEAGMNRLMEGRTVFIIAHRLSTVRDADTILVLDHGRIIERGNHRELLARKGRYYALYTGAAELS